MTETAQDIEELKRRYDELNQKRIRTDANLQNATKRLEELKEQACEEFGTDDVEDMREKLAEMKTENERKRSDYQSSLDRIETELVEVEKQYSKVEQDDSEQAVEKATPKCFVNA